MNYLYHTYTSNNPAGIDINLGYYALAECIIKGTWASVALSRWCDLSDVDKERHYKGKVTINLPKLKHIFKERFLTYAYLGEITGKSRAFYNSMFNGNRKYYPAELVSLLEEQLGLEKGALIKGEMK